MERSCAGITVFSQDLSQVLLVETPAGHLGFTKGKPEGQETLRQTAARETFQESGIMIKELRFEPTTLQQPLKEMNKRGTLSVQYYVACLSAPTSDVELKFDPQELKSVQWYAVDDALSSSHLLPERQAIVLHAHGLLQCTVSDNLVAGQLFFHEDNSGTARRTKAGASTTAASKPKPKSAQQPASKSKPSAAAQGKPTAAALEKLSKSLSYILRHGAVDLGLKVDTSGYVLLQDVLQLPRLRGATRDDVVAVVRDNEKQRFHIRADDDGREWIRANQGHSLTVASQLDDDEMLETLTTALPVCLHGTTFTAWKSIEVEGLKRMQRAHIHFTTHEPTEENRDKVLSGARMNSQVWIYVDMDKAMKAGIVFYRSRNGVILSAGQDGCIAPEYFERVLHVA